MELIIFCLFIVFVVFLYHSSGKRPNTPPGPRGIFGIVLDLSRKQPWKTFARWAEEHGETVYIDVLGNSVLILNSHESILAALEKQGTNFAHRPTLTIVGELMGLDQSLPLTNYNDRLRKQRKMTHLTFNASSNPKHNELKQLIVEELIRTLNRKPDAPMSAFRLAIGRMIVGTTYGFDIKAENDRYIEDAEKIMEMIGPMLFPGHPVDLLPALKYLPRWLPFHVNAAAAKSLVVDMVERPFEHAKALMKQGLVRSAFVQNAMEAKTDDENLDYYEHMVKWAAVSLYEAGSDSTSAVLSAFLVAMTTFPDKQAKAQKEIDSVVGLGRLPIISDREHLPYVNSLVKECMRWHVPLPLGFPRRSDAHDIFQGFDVPAETVILPNLWQLSRECQNPEAFEPERFLSFTDPKLVDPTTYAFGFGRRLCPGKQFALDSLFLVVSSVLSNFTIHLAKDSVPFVPLATTGLIR
ncbi:cytochrome P450 [Collybia nuda]|uniref:Cytochrome P450 n=1 Tax=Collybia nuda TaxID=64659 RepID=A0A9P5Y093_9AGAR|nr:cytochrome P450 [Collybia nuda]